MKRTIQFFMVLIISAMTFSCSSDDSTNLSSTEQKLVGKWFSPYENECGNQNYYNFKGNGTVDYVNYYDCQTPDIYSGVWKVEGNYLYSYYPNEEEEIPSNWTEITYDKENFVLSENDNILTITNVNGGETQTLYKKDI